MRLHAMTLSGFGPFAGEEVVDFDRLGADGLFLFCGATGAGKTSILDAVAFALYGRLPGARRETRNRVRSDHASPATTTYVELVCTLAGQTVRIRRSPEYERPKARGSGTTLQKHKVSLERRATDGSWVGVTDKADAVGDFVLDHLGLDADQFFQVVLLPQGEFARFLRAEDTERESVLKSLFDAERFTKVEDWFAALVRERRADLAVYESRLTELASRAAQEAGVDLPPTRPGDAWFERLVADATAAEAAERAAVRLADDAHTRTERALASARDVAARVGRRALLVAERGALESRRAGLDVERRRVEAALRVRSVRLLAEACAQTRSAHAAVAQIVRELRTEVGAVEPGLSHAPPRDLRQWLRSRRGALGALGDAQQDEVRLVELRTDEATVSAVEQQGAARLADLVTRRDTLPQRLEDTRREHEHLLVEAADVDAASEAQRVVAIALAAAKQALDLARDETGAQERLTDAVTRELAAKQEWLDLRERRLDGMAAELAADLADGQPCPVCGAHQHPALAAAVATAPDAGSELAAQTAYDVTGERRAAAQDALGEVRRQLAAAVALSGGEPLEQHERRLVAARERAATAAQARRSAARAEHAVVGLRHQVAALDVEIAAVTAEHATQRTRLEAVRAEIGQRADRVATSRGEHPTVAARVTALSATIDLVEQLDEAIREEAEATRAVDSARTQLDEEVSELGLSTDEALRVALTEAELATAQNAVRDFDAASAAVLAALSAPDLQGLPDEAPALDVVGVQETLTSSRLAHSRLTAEERRTKALSRLAASARVVAEEAGPALVELEEIDQLAGLIRGDTGNRHRMRLTSYVLAARLEQVAEVASQRLEAMSDGRYRLEHTTQRTNQRRTGGLGLVVRDAYTGRTRPTRTLSGGESFLASLALALGLAEVVAGEAGASTLDSLFVDEGFGSLDAETLDVVMDTLDELRAGGRAIGLISHVEEMKSRIQSKLHLVRDTTGSRILPPEGQLLPETLAAG